MGKKNDLTIAFGIGMYVLINHPEQFRCNAREQESGPTWLERKVMAPMQPKNDPYRIETYR